MEKETKNTLGGFEAFVDTIIPNFDKTPEIDNDDVEPINDDDFDDIKNQVDPVANKVKKQIQQTAEEEEEEEEIIDEPKRKPGRPKKEEVIEEIEEVEEEDDSEAVTNFFDAMSEELGWEFEEGDEKPKTVPELINYFKTVIKQ